MNTKVTKSELLQCARGYYEPSAVDRLINAIDLATIAHNGQMREGGDPYIVHPLSVAYYLIKWGMDIDTVIAGVLHDTVEDTNIALPEIEEQFGKSVAFLVDGVTKLSKARAGMRNLNSYLPETKDNLTKLLIATGEDIRVIIIKLADRLHNLSTLDAKTLEKQQKVARESLEIFAPLADRLNMGRVKVMIEELSFQYLDPTEYENIKRIRDEKIGAAEKKLEQIKREVNAELAKENLHFTINGRVKSIYSLYKKLKKNPINKIYDFIALRIIVNDIDDCYKVLGILNHLYIPLDGRIKDYISKPKLNGYQSLHTTVQAYDKNDEELIIEFQIRTNKMHDFAERGLAASFHYTDGKLTDSYKKRQIAELPDNLRWVHDLQKIAARMNETGAGDDEKLEKLKINLFNDKIFIKSPHGDIYDLPAGSRPLDFAYRIHSDLGQNANGFRVNEKMVDFDYILRDGDIVEVLINKNAIPKSEWLKKVSTKHAKNKIRQQLRARGEKIFPKQNLQKKK